MAVLPPAEGGRGCGRSRRSRAAGACEGNPQADELDEANDVNELCCECVGDPPTPEAGEGSPCLQAGRDVDAGWGGLDSRLRQVVDVARRLLPGGKMTSWQEDWVSPEVVDIYLRASHGQVAQAGEWLANALRWREEHVQVLRGERSPRWQGDMRVLACGEGGHPIVYACAAHQPRRASAADAVEHAAAVLEASLRTMHGGATSLDAVIDCHGFKMASNLDPWPLVRAGLTMRDPYRGRLRKAFIVDAPHAFKLLWNTFCTVLTEATRQKVFFVSKQEAVAQLASTAGAAAAASVERVMAGNRSGAGGVPVRLPSEVERTAEAAAHEAESESASSTLSIRSCRSSGAEDRGGRTEKGKQGAAALQPREQSGLPVLLGRFHV